MTRAGDQEMGLVSRRVGMYDTTAFFTLLLLFRCFIIKSLICPAKTRGSDVI